MPKPQIVLNSITQDAAYISLDYDYGNSEFSKSLAYAGTHAKDSDKSCLCTIALLPASTDDRQLFCHCETEVKTKPTALPGCQCC